jgi:hypothetical protein
VNNLVGTYSRAIGGCGVGIISILVFPTTRHSVLLKVFGIPFDRALRFHRGLAMLLWLCATLHGVLMALAGASVLERGLVCSASARRVFSSHVVTPQSIADARSRVTSRLVLPR